MVCIDFEQPSPALCTVGGLVKVRLKIKEVKLQCQRPKPQAPRLKVKASQSYMPRYSESQPKKAAKLQRLAGLQKGQWL